MKFSSIVSAVVACVVLAGCAADLDPLLVPTMGRLQVTVRDQGQNPVVGAVVQLRTTGSVVHAQQPTDANGGAAFDLGVGTWSVEIVVPTEYELSTSTVNPQIITLGSRDSLSVAFTLNQKNPDVLTGTVNIGWEWAFLVSCGQQRPWWIAGDADAVRVHNGWKEARYRGAHEVWVAARGRISGPGQYGHLGGYEREVRFSAVQDVREYRASDCPERRVSVAPRTTLLAPGDTLRIDLAVYDEAGNRINPVDIVWTSTNPTAATVANGLVSARDRGLTRIIASTGTIADTALIQVQWPWYMEGFASIRGSVRNPDGSPAANVPLYITCVDSWVLLRNTDASGNFELLYETPPVGYTGLTDARTHACRVQTSIPNDNVPAIGFLTAVYSRPGVAAPPVHVELVRTRRTGTLQLQADSRTLLPGDAAQVRVTLNGLAAENVRFRSLLPEVATVDATGRVTAIVPGTTTIIATSAADSTVIGWLDLSVRRF